MLKTVQTLLASCQFFQRNSITLFTMSAIQKKIEKILQKAEKCDKESDFQNDDQYLSFKTKKLKNSNSNEISSLAEKLENLEFIEESIYWWKKLLTIIDMCDKERHQKIYIQLMKLYTINPTWYGLLNYLVVWGGLKVPAGKNGH